MSAYSSPFQALEAAKSYEKQQLLNQAREKYKLASLLFRQQYNNENDQSYR